MAQTANMVGIARTRGIGTPVAIHVQLSPFFKKIYVDDPANIFFNLDQFAEPASYTHVSLGITETYAVIYDDPSAMVRLGTAPPLSMDRPQFQISEKALKHKILKGDTVLVRGKFWHIEDAHSDGVGVTTVFLRSK